MTATVITDEAFRALAAGYARKLDEDACFREAMTLICGSVSVARLFASPRGVTIATFARHAGLPVSTVRHYLRVGLITPYEVNGKYRFMAQHLAQAASVRQWRELGLSLDDILAMQQAERLGNQTILTAGELTILLRPVGDHHGTDRAHEGLNDEVRAQMGRALLEVRTARVRLEERLAELQAQVDRARRLESALGRMADELPQPMPVRAAGSTPLGRVLAAPVP